jgi:iron complex outermembrane recepter protein
MSHRARNESRMLSTRCFPVILVGLLVVCAAAAAVAAEPVTFTIESQAMGPALRAFAEQAKVQVFYDDKTVGTARTKGVKGTYEPEAALKALLEGSDLGYERSDAKTFVIVKAGAVGKSGSITGTVVDENGQPLAGIRVRALAGGAPVGAEAVADGAGVFEIANLLPGTYALRLMLEGVPDQEQPGAEVVAGTAATVAVTLDLRRALTAVEQITVTARRIDESITAAPVPVTAITERTIADLRLDSAPKLVQLVPNAFAEDTNGVETKVTLRGVGKGTQLFGDPGYGLFRNGRFWGGTMQSQGAVVDLEQLEVLRGPQGGLYGRNAIGGAINYVYATPRNETDAAVNLRYGSYDRIDADAMVNVPLAQDKLFARVVGWRYGQEEGEHYNISVGKELDRSEEVGGRFGLKWIFADNAYANLTYEKADTTAPASTVYFPFARPHPLAAYGFPPRPVEDKGTIRRNTFSYQDVTRDYAALDVVWAPAVGELTFTVPYWTADVYFTDDYDKTDDHPSDFPGALDIPHLGDMGCTSVAPELRWASPSGRTVRWQTGVSYFDEDCKWLETFPVTMDFSLLGLGPGLVAGEGVINYAQTVHSAAWYGEAGIALTEHVELSANLRYTHDEKSFLQDQGFHSDSPVLVAIFSRLLPTFTTAPSDVFEQWSPGAELAYRPQPTLTVFGRVSTGFRAGGFSYSSDPANIPYQEETAINYEAGVKTELLEGRLRLGASIFRFDQNDLLQRFPDPVLVGTYYLKNTGAARTNGLEGELEAGLARGLTAGLALGWLDAEYTKGQVATFTGGASIDAAGKRPLYVPEFTGNVRLMWSHALSGAVTLDANANASYRSDRVAGYGAPGQSDTMLDAATRVDLQAGVSFSQWQVLLFGENLTDDQSLTIVVPNGEIDRNQGRTYGIKLGYRMR